MTGEGRHRRVVRRGQKSDTLFIRRNKKYDKQFERWYNGLHLHHSVVNGFEWWKRHPTNPGIIHKGGKP